MRHGAEQSSTGCKGWSRRTDTVTAGSAESDSRRATHKRLGRRHQSGVPCRGVADDRQDAEHRERGAGREVRNDKGDGGPRLKEGANGSPSARGCLGVGHDGSGGWGEEDVVRWERGARVVLCGEKDRIAWAKVLTTPAQCSLNRGRTQARFRKKILSDGKLQHKILWHEHVQQQDLVFSWSVGRAWIRKLPISAPEP